MTDEDKKALVEQMSKPDVTLVLITQNDRVVLPSDVLRELIELLRK